MKLTNRDLATLIDALRDAEAYKRSVLDAELPPLPRADWEPADRQQEFLWRRAVRAYRGLRVKLQRIEQHQVRTELAPLLARGAKRRQP